MRRYLTTICLGAFLALFALPWMAWAQEGAAPAGSVRWMNNLDEALRLAQQTNRPILVHFWADWCKPCMALETEVFSKPAVIATIEGNFIPVKLNADQNAELAKKYNVDSLPTDVVLSSSGTVLTKFNSPPTVTAYAQQIGQIAGQHMAKVNEQISNLKAKIPANSPYVAMGTGLAGMAYNKFAGGGNGAATQPAPEMANAYPQPQGGAVAIANPFTQQGAAGSLGSNVGNGNIGNNASNGNNVAPAPAQVAANANLVGDRYAAQALTNQVAMVNPRVGNCFPPFDPQVSPAPQIQSTPQGSQIPSIAPPVGGTGVVSASFAPNSTPVAPSIPVQPPVNPMAPVGNTAQSEFALDGYCPVALVQRESWIKGDKQFGAVHRGRTYLFSGLVERNKFLENPDFYSPVLSGADPVIAIEQNQTVPGVRKHGVRFRDRVYLFSSEATLQRFSQNPARYSAGIEQALRQPQGQPVYR